MNKNSILFTTISVLMISMLMSSCGKIGKSLIMSKAEGYKTTLVPVYTEFEANGEKRLFWGMWHRAYALKSPSGGYEKFDNEGDYAEYGTFLTVVGDISTWYNTDIYEELLAKYGKDSNIRMICTSEENDLLNKAEVSIINDVAEYLYGDKTSISDNNRYNQLEKYYYDHHPEEFYFDIDISRYGEKTYKGKRNGYPRYLVAMPAKENQYYFSDHTPVPEGTLILQ